MPGFVDYEHQAARYRAGRALPDEALGRWGRAVRPYLPEGRCRLVLDAGAGTGLFAAARPQWAGVDVVALEPAAAMVDEGAAAAPRARFVLGVAERLPLAGATFDVAWLSTSLHHLADRASAATELARVLRPGGRALVRTYLPGRSVVSFLEASPGRDKWIGRFPTEAEIGELFSAAGFGPVGVRQVHERDVTYGQSAEWAARMRHTDSILAALDDEELASGLARLRADPGRVGHIELALLAFERG